MHATTTLHNTYLVTVFAFTSSLKGSFVPLLPHLSSSTWHPLFSPSSQPTHQFLAFPHNGGQHPYVSVVGLIFAALSSAITTSSTVVCVGCHGAFSWGAIRSTWDLSVGPGAGVLSPPPPLVTPPPPHGSSGSMIARRTDQRVKSLATTAGTSSGRPDSCQTGSDEPKLKILTLLKGIA